MEAQSIPHGGGISLPRSRRLLAPLGDDRLVEQVRRGNEAAFEVIFDRHHRGILAFCRHMLASAEEAEDAVQHTFIQAYDSMRRSSRDLKLKAWLYAIARNRCISVLRARREQAAEVVDIPTAGLSEEVQQRSDLREMLGDIRELPEEQRAALVLSEIGDLSHPEIAMVVGCEASKVKSLVFQARSSLIESRRAREIPCHEIREQLATATGGALRRAPLRRHLKHCEGCAEFRADVARQRRALAALIPVVPSAALKQGALSALGIGGGAATASKTIAILALAGATVGGGVAATESITHHTPPAAKAAAAPPAAAMPRARVVATSSRPVATRQVPAAPASHRAHRSKHAVAARSHHHRQSGTHASAPAPDAAAPAKTHTNNGNHYGQTKTHGPTKVKTAKPPKQKPDKPVKVPHAALPTGPPLDAPGVRKGNKHND
jgi:RNA polymerase sigma factor (sigma-70 family)